MTVLAWWFDGGIYKGMATIWENGQPVPLPRWFANDLPRGEITLTYGANGESAGTSNDGRTIQSKLVCDLNTKEEYLAIVLQ